MLKLMNVSIAYKDKVVLENLNFSANKGEIVGVAAPNGTGKTTMFNIIANFVKPDSGKVIFDDQYEYRNEKEELLIHKQLVIFPEQKDLFEELSGVDHLKLYADIWNGSSKKVPKIIERLQMGHYVKKKVKTYSLGMRQRLCFAMLMAADTPIMLMDEVMNGLDISNVALISDCLIDMKKQNKLIFVASHLLENLDLYADRVIFLKNGSIIHEQVFTSEPEAYLKVEISPSNYGALASSVKLPAGHLYIADYLLCIPLTGMDRAEQTAWFDRLLDWNEKTINVGPLGTVEHYEKYYSINK